MHLFDNKIIAVTGGAEGIGKNIAKEFGHRNATVLICDSNSEKGTETELELQQDNISAKFIQTDLSKKGEPQALIRNVVDHYGKLDILVNNARSGPKLNMFAQNLFEESEDSWDECMTVTLKAAFFTTQEAIRLMSQSTGGCIINISSILSQVVGNASPSYHAAKAGLNQLTRYFAVYGSQYNIRVNCILAGFIVQDRHLDKYESNSNIKYRQIAEFCSPTNQVGTSDDISKATVFLCSDDSSYISGASIVVDGGMTLQEQSSLMFDFDKTSKKQ